MADMTSTGQENDIVQPKKISGLAFHLSFLCFSPFNLFKCCFAAWQRGLITLNICRLCFVPINSVLLNLLCIRVCGERECGCKRHENQSDLSVYNCRVCGEQKCGCKRHDNQTFLFIIVGCVESWNVDAKDTTIRPFCL